MYNMNAGANPGMNPNAYDPGLAMRQRLMAMQQSYQPQPTYQPQQFVPSPMPLQMKGRAVTSFDEVKAAQIDFDGSVSYFPSPSEQCIYAKFIGLDGLPVMQVYKLSSDQPAAPKRYADAETVEALQQKVVSLERYLKGENNHANEPIDHATDIQPTAQQP